MEYERAYVDRPEDWEPVSEEYVRERLDGPYRDVDMAVEYLHEAGTIRTPFARVVSESVEGNGRIHADCAEADRQMEMRSEIDRRRRTESDDTAP